MMEPPSLLPAARLGLPLAVTVLLVFTSLGFFGILENRRRGLAALTAIAAALVAAMWAVLASDLVVVYGAAIAATAFGWAAALLDPRSSRAGLRAGGHYALAATLGDTAILGAAVALTVDRADLAAGGLLIAGAVRLMAFPLHLLPAALSRLPGRATIAISVAGNLIGVGLLGRAFLAVAGEEAEPTGAGVLVFLGIATVLVAVLLLPLARSYRLALDQSWLGDAGHLLVAFGLGTPLALAAGLLLVLNSALARTTLLAIADATSQTGQQRRRIPEGIGLIPFGLSVGALAGAPPLPGFVARWLLYLALFEAEAAPIALVLALGTAVTFVTLLTALGRLQRPARRGVDGAAAVGLPRALLVGLAPLWAPLALVVVAPILAMNYVIAPAVELMRPEAPWLLGADRLLGVNGVLALLLTLSITFVAFAAYLQVQPRQLRPLAAAWRAGRRLAPARQTLERAAAAGFPFGLLAGVGEMLGQGVQRISAHGERRHIGIWFIGVAAILVLVALG